MDESRLEKLFQRQVSIDMTIEVLLDYWEEGRDKDLGLTRDFVRETIYDEVQSDKTVGDILADAHGIYEDRIWRRVMESMLSNGNPKRRRMLIDMFASGSKIQEVYYGLPENHAAQMEYIGKIIDRFEYLLYSLPKRKAEQV